MRYLLDTHALIWAVEGVDMAAAAIEAINAAAANDQQIFVSPISAWERGLLIAKGRITSPIAPGLWFDRVVAMKEIALADLTPGILTDSSFLPLPVHNDPADRILITTARTLDLTIITRDRAILRYAALGHVKALAC
ncbi:MAG: type II toxin-antitoxin system VapC family toxin [Devosia sp.]|nr:MAG: type II toxin-antitoxin system VapC family toxin [Devosia sp.]